MARSSRRCSWSPTCPPSRCGCPISSSSEPGEVCMDNVARFAAALGLMTAVVSAGAGTVVYVSNADSQDISVLALDRASGQVTPLQTVPLGGTVMPLALSPDRKLLYAALRSQPYRVATLAIEADGRLRKLG